MQKIAGLPAGEHGFLSPAPQHKPVILVLGLDFFGHDKLFSIWTHAERRKDGRLQEERAFALGPAGCFDPEAAQRTPG